MRRLSFLTIALFLLITTEAFGQQETWSDTLWFDHPLNRQDTVTTRAVYVGNTDPRTLTVWTKADENDGNVDIKILYQFKLKRVGRFGHGWSELEYQVKDHMKDAGWNFWRFIEPTKTKAVDLDTTVVGQNLLIELEEARNLELISLNFRLVTDATDAERYVKVIISDPASTVFTRLQCTTAQSANQTRQYSFFPGIPEIGPSNILSIFQGPMPPNLVLKGGATIEINVTNIRANDEIKEITLGWRRGVQSEFAFNMPGAADSLRFIVSGNAANGDSIDVYLTVSGKK